MITLWWRDWLLLRRKKAWLGCRSQRRRRRQRAGRVAHHWGRIDARPWCTHTGCIKLCWGGLRGVILCLGYVWVLSGIWRGCGGLPMPSGWVDGLGGSCWGVLPIDFLTELGLFWLVCCWGPIAGGGGVSGVIRIGRRGRSISCPLRVWSCGWGGLWGWGLVPLGSGCHGWAAILGWIGSAGWWKLGGPVIWGWDLV